VTIFVKATFIGRDDFGYQYGHTYLLRLDQHWAGRIVIIATHGYEHKPVVGMQRTYVHLGAFLQDWKAIDTSDTYSIAKQR
jgi:hypothetical protein